ncbi:Pyridoxal phosphate-dependent decarboxylase, partial [Dillenia turbinata]
NGQRRSLELEAIKPMDAEQLRESAHKMVDFIADYYKTIENFPALSQVEPGYHHKLLPDSAPYHPEPLQDNLNDVAAKILPGATHWQSPNYFTYYPSKSSIAGFPVEMLSAGIVGFSWVTSPAATELEMIVLDWLTKLLKLLVDFLSKGQGGGVIQATASESVLVVLLAARDRVLRRVGKNALEKQVEFTPKAQTTDSATNFALSPEVVADAISRNAASGTTLSTAVDPLAAFGKIAQSNGIWFHIDAAYAGSACICSKYHDYIHGLEDADSFNMNAHKWFLTNFDSSDIWVKASEGNMIVDYKDWKIPLGHSGEMLSAGINIVGFSWVTSPAATELEMIVLDWLITETMDGTADLSRKTEDLRITLMDQHASMKCHS